MFLQVLYAMVKFDVFIFEFLDVGDEVLALKIEVVEEVSDLVLQLVLYGLFDVLLQAEHLLAVHTLYIGVAVALLQKLPTYILDLRFVQVLHLAQFVQVPVYQLRKFLLLFI